MTLHYDGLRIDVEGYDCLVYGLYLCVVCVLMGLLIILLNRLKNSYWD
jgi:hypothetical protein